MKFIITLTAICMLFSFGDVVAQDTGTVIGEGALPCKKFKKASGRGENNFIIWVQGYFSAYNAIAPDIQNITQGQSFHWIKDRLKTYCKANPDAYFNDAVQALVAELHPTGIQTNDGKIVPPEDLKPIIQGLPEQPDSKNSQK